MLCIRACEWYTVRGLQRRPLGGHPTLVTPEDDGWVDAAWCGFARKDAYRIIHEGLIPTSCSQFQVQFGYECGTNLLTARDPKHKVQIEALCYRGGPGSPARVL